MVVDKADEPEPVYDIRPPSSEPEYRPLPETKTPVALTSSTTRAQSSPTSKYEYRPPVVGTDADLPEREEWPGPFPNGSYGDWTDGLITEEQHQVSNKNQRQQRSKGW